MKYEKACGAVIVNHGRVLLVHQQNDLWGFPKGHVEPHESELETAEREVKEETGLDIIIDPSARFRIEYYIQELDVQKEVILFLAQLKDPSAACTRQESEIAELRWVPYADVEATLNFPEWKAIWRDILAHLQPNS